MTKIKMGDKLYVVVRADLEPGQQAVQAMHALRQFTHEHPEADLEWFTVSNFIALLSVPDEEALLDVADGAYYKKVRYALFREPDQNNEFTAIALEASPISQVICKNLPLALKSRDEKQIST